MKDEVSAIIVARKGSIRVKSKSMLKLGNETLISRKIKQLQAAKHIDRVIFGSDSDEMLEHAKSYGAEVFKRPDFYCDETKASANDMIENMISLIKTDIVVWAHCTNPLLSSETYDRAVSVFQSNQARYDSLLSVREFKEHLWGEDKKPLNYNPYQARHVLACELPSYYMQDGGIFIQSYKQMAMNRYFFGKKPYLFVIPDEEFLDINDMRDYLLAKAILENKNG
ncbi:MAG: acylneuraminate cytidylyltransferase family protein [Campylobacteraceae bacterium]|jgi:CMP-N-acetylneuraminic acid synthetase|nr:acylneuraminate cytidylyltransferase family protein [Campylobacteraceae bacterium]